MEATGGYEQRAFGQLVRPACRGGCQPARRPSVRQSMGIAGEDRRHRCRHDRLVRTDKEPAATPGSADTGQSPPWSRRLRQLTEVRDPGDQPPPPGHRARHPRQLRAHPRRHRRPAAPARNADRPGDRQRPLWARLDAAFRTIKGVADRTVARLMAEMPEIGTLSNKAVGKLAGLAPIARDGGQHSGEREVPAAAKGIRDILFVVAEVVAPLRSEASPPSTRRLVGRRQTEKAHPHRCRPQLLVQLNAKARDVRRENALPA